jgi:RNA-directed DNA polymerase
VNHKCWGKAVRLRGWSTLTMVIATLTMWTTINTFVRSCAEDNHHPLFNFHRLYKAYIACRRNKRNKADALEFELNHEHYLTDLVEELRKHRYRPLTSTFFYTDKPKHREICAADFRDRIVHHLVYSELAPRWEKVFIYHSYACRPGKGTHKAAQALQGFITKASRNGQRRVYFLKMDIYNFFMSIDRRKLFTMLASRCHDPDLLWLIRIIVFHNPTHDYRMLDSDNLRYSIPPHKSLFNARPFCGIPIGNLTSQFFANVYLNALDQFVKHQLKCKYYLRYVDDFVLLDPDPVKLQKWKDMISDFLSDTLALSLNEKATKVAPVSGGVDFAGFIIRWNYMLVRRRVVGSVKAKLRSIKPILISDDPEYTVCYFHPPTLELTHTAINSYLGHFKHAQARQCEKRLWNDFSFINDFFTLSTHKIIPFYKPLYRIRSLKKQVRWLHRHFPGYICLIEVGCYFETFDRSALKLNKATRLALLEKWRGFSWGCGFPLRRLKKVMGQLIDKSLPVVIVRQGERRVGTIRIRLPYLTISPVSYTEEIYQWRR